MISDAFKIVEIDDIAYEVDCKVYLFKILSHLFQDISIKEGADIDIGANASAEEQAEELEDGMVVVNNVVYSFRLQKTAFDKKSYMTYIKSYMKAIKKSLSESNPDRVAEFEKKATPFVKKILENFKNYDFYVGESMNPEGAVVLLDYREDGITPFLTFFKDGLKIEKLVNIQSFFLKISIQ